LPRAGNAGDNFYYDPATGNSINAWGIPNKGIDERLKELPQTRKEVNALGAQFAVSISAGDTFDAQEYYEMADALAKREAADIIEGNFSCGNMKVGNEYKPVVCYDLKAFDAGVAALCLGAGTKKKAAKLTPTTERRFLFGNVESCLKYGIDYLILANTIPNSHLEKPDGTHAIDMIRGGLGGRGLIPIVTGMIQLVAPILKGTPVKLIAAGGVDFGRDAYHYLKHGAHGFEFGSLLWKNNFDPTVGQKVIVGDPDKNEPGLIDLLVERGLPS
jgi:dihydroorotate dehydrogenase